LKLFDAAVSVVVLEGVPDGEAIHLM
jgi:hypothetical protein